MQYCCEFSAEKIIFSNSKCDCLTEFMAIIRHEEQGYTLQVAWDFAQCCQEQETTRRERESGTRESFLDLAEANCCLTDGP